MPRSGVSFGLFLVFAAISLAAVVSCLLMVYGGVPPVWGGGERRDSQLRAGKSRELRKKLDTKVNLDKGIDVSTPLKDALEYLSDRYDVTIIVDENAFAQIGVQKASEQPVTLPKMVGVNMSTVLRLLLGQVKGDYHCGTFVLRGDFIEITTTAHTSLQEWGNEYRLTVPTVDADFERVPLDDALSELSDTSGINVLVDTRVADQARKPVTAHLNGVALDTAVRLLTDMAGLRPVFMDNVIYITSKDNARALQEEQDKRTVKMKEMQEKAKEPLLGKKEDK